MQVEHVVRTSGQGHRRGDERVADRLQVLGIDLGQAPQAHASVFVDLGLAVSAPSVDGYAVSAAHELGRQALDGRLDAAVGSRDPP